MLKYVYHLPKETTWDAELLSVALQKRGIAAAYVGDFVAMRIPIDRFDIDRILNATTIDELKPEFVGLVHAIISFQPSAVLENIVVHYTRSFESDCYPRISDVTSAILDCGYVAGSHRELANKYYTGQIDIDAIFAKLEELQVEKEQAITERRFCDAEAILDEQKPLRQQIETLLRNSMRDG